MRHLSVARVLLGLCALALVATGLLYWQQGDQRTGVTLAAQAQTGGPKPFARSLQGTLPDGDLQPPRSSSDTEGSGALAYGELRRLFDYYLSTVGEQSVEAITAQIRSELPRRLPAPQAQKAQQLLDRYIAFKRDLVGLEDKPDLSGSAVAAIRRRMLAVQDLRAHHFSADENQGMFGFEDAYDRDAIARLEISQNPALNVEQKKQQLTALDASLPAALRAEREASNLVVRIEQQATDMRARGASEDDIYRMRAKELDPQAATRLADVDREEAAWKDRIAHYRDERTKLLKANANATESERQASLTQLQQSLFTEAERPRLAAYE
ncbi:lipase chaperone [Rhodoferax lithotrophicus]|uniref:Lipase chaperone n=1 Tax=Rhodoferax lithotrophicus TaxID=2798804 RepID=A0ABN6D967_9BURK|nr:lipase secretion chaperone [Rhodoferax sp. MIZ03]BCO26528.1 lipase chaperone [Rhodoferax sp. MIZ03]